MVKIESKSIINRSFYLKSKDLNSCINLYNKMANIITQKTVLHYPQLDTVLLVEDFIRAHSGEFKKRKLWEHLPRKMMYQTFCVIFNYLLDSGKIAVDRERKIGWIWDPEGVKKFLANPKLRWKKSNLK